MHNATSRLRMQSRGWERSCHVEGPKIPTEMRVCVPRTNQIDHCSIHLISIERLVAVRRRAITDSDIDPTDIERWLAILVTNHGVCVKVNMPRAEQCEH